MPRLGHVSHAGRAPGREDPARSSSPPGQHLHAEMRRLARVDLLILDDFALRPLDAAETNDFYELVVERHRKAATILTSNR